jgi:hypothetical protein
MKRYNTLKCATIGGGLVLILCGVVAFVWYFLSPRYALRQIKGAIEAHDYTAFRKHVDVPQVASKLFDDILKQLKGGSQSGGGFDEPSWTKEDGLGEWVLKGLGSVLKPKWVTMIEEKTAAAVENRPFKTFQSLGLDRLFGGKPAKEAQKARREFFEKLRYEGVASQQRQGNTARLGLRFRYDDKPEAFVLDVVMNKEGGRWRIVEAPNLADLLVSFAD